MLLIYTLVRPVAVNSVESVVALHLQSTDLSDDLPNSSSGCYGCKVFKAYETDIVCLSQIERETCSVKNSGRSPYKTKKTWKDGTAQKLY